MTLVTSFIRPLNRVLKKTINSTFHSLSSLLSGGEDDRLVSEPIRDEWLVVLAVLGVARSDSTVAGLR